MSADDQTTQHSTLPNHSQNGTDSRRETGIRLLYVILFGIIYSVGELVFFAVVVFQFGYKLITGNTSERLLAFSDQLTRFLYEVLRYMTMNSDVRPFPFSDWPSSKDATQQAGGDS